MIFTRLRPLRSLPQRRLASSTTTTTKPPNLHTNFYRTHGRALFKSLTMAFLSYQIFYWAWITLEAETGRDEKRATIKSLEEEARLLGNGVGSHRLLEEKPEQR